MKVSQMVIFFTIVLSVYFLGNLYFFLKGLHAIEAFRNYKTVYLVSFSVLALTFIAGKIIEARHSGVLSDILNVSGGFWMALILYGFIFLLLTDIAFIVLRLTGILDSGNILTYRKWAYIGTVAVSVILIAGGFVNAISPVVKEYDITINKSAGDIDQMRIAAVSDIHLGSTIRKRSIKKLSAMLTKLRPDLVLLLGDVVDGELGPVIRDDLLKYFTCPVCRNGLYAITGNHEFIGGANRTIPYIESKGIRILKDETVTLAGGIQLIGRLDRDSERFFGKGRKPLKELMAGVDTTKPVIVLDHQPVNLNETVDNSVDLQLSGHTHNGQMWPLNYVTRKIYELSYGYLRKGNTQFIVSSGFGLWGPRIRSGSRSEVLLINIRFKKQ